MAFLFSGNKISQSDIEQLIHNRIERSIKLEFKSGNELSLTNQHKINKFAVTVSAFANTIGGILIYGIDAKYNKAHSFSFINSNEITEKGLYSILNNKIQKPINGLFITPIHFDNDISKTVYVISIPQSSDSPHITFDNRYYKRHKFTNAIMEEHEIRMLYNKSGKSDIEFFALLNTNGIPTIENGKFTNVAFYPRFLIKNISNIIEHSYKFEISFPSAIYDTSFTALQEYFVRFDGVNSVFSIPNRSPIFQDEIATVLETKMIVNKANYDVFADNKLNIKLFFSNGVKTYHYNLIDTFIYKSKQLLLNDFA